MARWTLLAALALAASCVACGVSAQTPTVPAMAPAVASHDVHIHAAAVSQGDASVRALREMEEKFMTKHNELLAGLDSVLNKVDEHMRENAQIGFVETEDAFRPVEDNTGSAEFGAPKANLTRFHIKPTIDGALVPDAALVKPALLELANDAEGESDVVADMDVQDMIVAEANTQAQTQTQAETELDAEAEAQFETEVEVDSADESTLDTEADIETETESEASVDAETEGEIEADSEADSEAEFESDVEAEAEVEADSELDSESAAETDDASELDVNAESEAEDEALLEADAESSTEAAAMAAVDAAAKAELEADQQAQFQAGLETYVASQVADAALHSQTKVELENASEHTPHASTEADDQYEHDADLLMEVGAKPIVDDTGSLGGMPQVNTTQYPVKPLIDPKLVLDAGAALVEVEDGVTMDLVLTPIIDGTGSAASGAPKANLTRFHIKPTIDASLMLDTDLARASPAAPTPVAAATTATPTSTSASKPKAVAPRARFAARAQAQKSLLEVESCPGCRNAGRKQASPVVEHVGGPNPLDAPLLAEQHRRVDYLIEPVKSSLSIKERHLTTAQKAVVDAAEAHERFAEYTETLANQPLIPQP